jgi:uracil-DNA glycosylase
MSGDGALKDIRKLEKEARACEVCVPHLPLGPRPIFSISTSARVLLIGQAPGKAAHETNTPWNDPSGVRLRDWLGVSDEQFYDAETIALMPMGFCYPGKGKSGDMPPRKECAPLWHPPFLDAMGQVELTVYIGRYAFERYLGSRYKTLTEAVRDHASLLPEQIVLLHPSPRNQMWMKRNAWFAEDALPALKSRVAACL